MYNVALVPAEYRADRVDTDEATTCHSCSKWYHTPFRFLGKSLALSINALRSQQAKCLFFHLPTHCMLGMLTMFQAIKTGINPAFILGFHSSQSSQEPPEVMYFGNRILQFTKSFCCSTSSHWISSWTFCDSAEWSNAAGAAWEVCLNDLTLFPESCHCRNLL